MNHYLPRIFFTSEIDKLEKLATVGTQGCWLEHVEKFKDNKKSNLINLLWDTKLACFVRKRLTYSGAFDIQYRRNLSKFDKEFVTNIQVQFMFSEMWELGYILR